MRKFLELSALSGHSTSTTSKSRKETRLEENEHISYIYAYRARTDETLQFRIFFFWRQRVKKDSFFKKWPAILLLMHIYSKLRFAP